MTTKVVQVGDHPPEVAGVPQGRALELWSLREARKHITSCKAVSEQLALVAKQIDGAVKAGRFNDLQAASAKLREETDTLIRISHSLAANVSLAHPMETRR